MYSIGLVDFKYQHSARINLSPCWYAQKPYTGS